MFICGHCKYRFLLNSVHRLCSLVQQFKVISNSYILDLIACVIHGGWLYILWRLAPKKSYSCRDVSVPGEVLGNVGLWSVIGP